MLLVDLFGPQSGSSLPLCEHGDAQSPTALDHGQPRKGPCDLVAVSVLDRSGMRAWNRACLGFADSTCEFMVRCVQIHL